ncbi:MAG: UDP-galactose-4-epimerase [Methanoregulaceae archaeon PtaU1.Bin059]|nr:MAG: UDP-galactose-4-epimerase [Methanoregulaceae archaeon PtaB.Bin152]OPY43806.1 MAG: UDP-galactose-4-epimerase [Methanoregulaceae archaeon PtaU1.Bin059]
MKVGIFGASGFVGRNIIKKLQANNIDLIASDIQNLDIKGVEFVKADLLNPLDVSNIVKDVDVIIHLAAHPLPASIEHPKMNAKINIEGTLNILDAAKEYGIDNVIFSSASSIVGKVDYSPVDEDHPCFPKTPYGVAKLSIEHYLRVYQELYNLNYLTFRFFNLYGPEQHPASGALIPMVFKKLKEDGSFNVFGDGNQMRDFIYVEDIAEIYYRALHHDIRNQVVNLGTGKGSTIKDIIEKAGKILNVSPTINYLPARPGEIDNFVADIKKFQKIFQGFSFTPIDEGLRKTFEWLSNI